MLSRLESALETQKESSTLKLCDLFIGDEGCNALAQYLRTNDTFVSIDLRGNNIGQGFVFLSDYLSKSKSLKQY